MGGGGGSDSNQNPGITPIEYQDLLAAQGQASKQTMQFLAGLGQDWLKTYGQAESMKAAGIPAPFSTISGGFQTPFLSTSGAPQGGAGGR